MKLRTEYAGGMTLSLMAVAVLLTGATTFASSPKGGTPSFDTAKIEQITGLKGVYNEEEGVFKVSNPRTDVKITVDKTPMLPFMGLTAWAAFSQGTDSNLMLMGDIVLFQDEVNPAMSAALDNGLQVTALHNHFFFDNPKVYFMHIAGDADLVTLATGVRKVFDATKEVRAKLAQPADSFGGPALPDKSSITAKPIEDVFGMKAQAQAGMAKIVIGRQATMPCGCTMGKEMGVNTWAAFMGSDDNAIVDGDVAMHEDELQDVLKSLRHSGINIVAIHHHMTMEQPRIIFLHYWGQGKAEALAKAVKAAVPKDENVGPMCKR